MTTAIAKVGGGLTVADLLLLELPHLTEEQREFVVWEYTGFPCFWRGDAHPIWQLRWQLRDYRDNPAWPREQAEYEAEMLRVCKELNAAALSDAGGGL